jgi:eukaryotic-like serine/threonine-protein kinase
VTDPAVPSSDSELRAYVERALGAHYELDCEIGRGGMGIVYRAKDRRLKRTVAIKVLPPELAFRSEIKVRFLREAETAAQLNHPNIVDIYSVDELQQLVFFVMAYIPGDNLAKRLHDQGAMSVDDTRRIVRDVADALAYAHERGVVHRDIKPDNILIDQGSGRPMVTDFGIARAITEGDNRLTATGIAIGTPTYMSPEQAAGDREIDGRSDLYALGIVAYQMLTGQPPFVASSTPAMLVKHLSERPTPLQQRRSDVPPDLSRAIMMLLEKDPAARFPSAGALVKALDGAPSHMAGESSSSPRASSSYPQPVAALSPAGGFGSSKAPEVGGGNPFAEGPFGDQGTFTGQMPMPATLDEQRRWNDAVVVKFRRLVAPYLYVNSVIIIAAVFSPHNNYTGVTVIWTIWLAWKYAKLWSNGHDWHDVFRQPREREIIDVVEDTVGYVKAMANPQERARLRSERRSRAMAARTSGSMPMPDPRPMMRGSNQRMPDANMEVVHRAQMDRDEILRIIAQMSSSDRARVPDVGRSASLLAERVQSLAISLADLDRSPVSDSVSTLEAEISKLEGDANPLDKAGSETRVKRLAFLKRQRRGLADVVGKRKAIAGKLETCSAALASMRLDLTRLITGDQSHQHVTSLAMEALSLADSVDHALAAADEVGRITSNRPITRTT